MPAFKPLQDRVLVKRIEQETKTPGGIIIPETATEKPQEGEVVAVGPGARDETARLQPRDVKTGDRTLVGQWSGTEAAIDIHDHLNMKTVDTMGDEVGRQGKEGP